MAASHPHLTNSPSDRTSLSDDATPGSNGMNPTMLFHPNPTLPPSLPLFSGGDDVTRSESTSASALTSKSGGGGVKQRCQRIQKQSSSASRTTTTSGNSKHRNRITSNGVDIESAKALSRRALMENDALVYLDGPMVYTCGQCRTHLTSHDDIISKSFHGRRGELRCM
jgi:hypothetical protein